MCPVLCDEHSVAVCIVQDKLPNSDVVWWLANCFALQVATPMPSIMKGVSPERPISNNIHINMVIMVWGTSERYAIRML